MKIRTEMRTHIVLIVILAGVFAAGLADIVSPDWILGADVVSVIYRFETGGAEPEPSGFVNLIWQPYMKIDPVNTAVAGWAEPGTPFITRSGNGGSWQIGETGFIDLVLPLVLEPGPDLYLDLYIEVIAASGVDILPLIEVENLMTTPYTHDEVIEPDPFWSWSQLVSTGQVSLATSPSLTIKFTGNDATAFVDGTTFDQIAVYARVIPEPTAMALIGLSGLLTLLARRLWYA